MCMNSKFKISVVIPTYNRSGFVVQAIKSVLSQRFDAYEIIVSDNASTDDTLGVLSQFSDEPRIKVFSNDTNIGMVANWRLCVETRISGDWFLLLSDDDLLIDPYFLAKVQAMIEINPDLGFVYANGYLFDVETTRIDRLFLPYKGVVSGDSVISSYGTILAQNFTLCNIVFNRTRALASGCFLSEQNICCDEELFLQLAIANPVGCIQDCVSIYRTHTYNLSRRILTDPEFHFYRVNNILKAWDILRELKAPYIYNAFKRNTRLLKILKDLLDHLERSGKSEFLSYLDSSYPDLVKQASVFKDRKIDYLCVRLRMKILKYLKSPIQACVFLFFGACFSRKVRRLL